MRKVIFAMSTSLDGFIEGPNGDIGWQVVDAELHRYVNDRERDIGAYLLGRRLYEVMAAYWPTADTNLMSAAYEVEYARIWKSKLKIVFSRTLERVEGNARLVRGDVLGEVQRLKAEPGGDLVLGGADLASTFMQYGLIDEYDVYVHPVLLGGGTPMFRALASTIDLQLVETRPFHSGVVLLRYRRAGEEA